MSPFLPAPLTPLPSSPQHLHRISVPVESSTFKCGIDGGVQRSSSFSTVQQEEFLELKDSRAPFPLDLVDCGKEEQTTLRQKEIVHKDAEEAREPAY
ncbi:hypothetical protein Q5P01_023074 [Channa striata]|uniref:Uncharacterized protein n=1 Tax=Channa striata TaxID=64152 RepID=A0AA88LNN9_CHASR|nr:hypothetical protein Q5P01_023074 [Channa striata]